MPEQLKSFGTLNPPGEGELNIANRILLPVGKDLLAGDVKAKLTIGICSRVVLPSLPQRLQAGIVKIKYAGSLCKYI